MGFTILVGCSKENALMRDTLSKRKHALQDEKDNI